MTVYYTCTVDSRTDPKSGTVFFSFRFHASTHHCRYYCLFLAVNYKNTLPPSPSSSSSFSPPSSSIVLVQRPQVTNDHKGRVRFDVIIPFRFRLTDRLTGELTELYRISSIKYRKYRSTISSCGLILAGTPVKSVFRRKTPDK